MRWFRSSAYACALALMLTVADAQPSGSIRFLEPYAVEGIAVGTPVVPDSWQYKRYNCRPSAQYANSTWCTFSETKDGVTKILTIMHLYNNTVTYCKQRIIASILYEFGYR